MLNASQSPCSPSRRARLSLSVSCYLSLLQLSGSLVHLNKQCLLQRSINKFCFSVLWSLAAGDFENCMLNDERSGLVDNGTYIDYGSNNITTITPYKSRAL